MAKSVLSRLGRAAPVVLLGLVLVYAARERFRLPLTPTADPDIWVYLKPPLSKLLGGDFGHEYGQCFLYPAWLYAILGAGQDFRWITVLQNGLGLGTGALLYGCWLEVRRWLPTPRLPTVVFNLIGVLLAWVYLLSTTSIGFERALRPESVFPFFVLLHIFCNLRFLRDRFLQPRPRRAVVWGGLAAFFAVATFLLKPSFSGSMFLAGTPLVVSLFRPGQSPGQKLALVGWPLLAAGLLLLGPEWNLRRGDTEADLFLSRSLFSIHADFIDEQMEADLAARAQGPFPLEFVAQAHQELSRSLHESRTGPGKHWPTLGFNADYLVYGDATHGSFADWLRDRQPDRGVAFYRYYYRRAVQQRPGRLAAKVGRQFGKFYGWGQCPAFQMSARLDLGKSYRQTVESMSLTQRRLDAYPPRKRMEAAAADLQQTPLQVGPFPVTMFAARCLEVGHLPGVLWSGALLAAVAVRPRWRSRYGRIAAVLALLYAYNFGTVLTLAFSHSLDVGRYSLYQFAYTVLPEAAAGWLAVEVISGVPVLGQGSLLAIWRRLSTPWRAHPPAWEGILGPPELASPGEGARAVFVTDAGQSPVTAAAEQLLMQSYADGPADLLIGHDGSRRGWAATLAGGLVRYVFGWSPRDLFSGALLCSHRLCPGGLRTGAVDGQGWRAELVTRALAGGYSIRDVELCSLPRHPVQDPVPHRLRTSWRFLGTLLARCLRLRPWVVSLGIIGLGLCVAGLALSGYSWRQAHMRRSHYNIRKVLASPVALGTGLLCFEAGLLLGTTATRQ